MSTFQVLYKPQQFYANLFQKWPNYGKLMLLVMLVMVFWGLSTWVVSRFLMVKLGLFDLFLTPEAVPIGAALFQSFWMFLSWLVLSVAMALGASFNARPFEMVGYALTTTLPVGLLMLTFQLLAIWQMPQITPQEMDTILNSQNGPVVAKLVQNAELSFLQHPLVLLSHVLMAGSILWQGWVLYSGLANTDTPAKKRLGFCIALVVVFGALQYNFAPQWRLLTTGVIGAVIQPEQFDPQDQGNTEM